MSKDVPNSKLGFSGGKWGTKIEEEFTIRPIGDFSEVTVLHKFRLTFDFSARQEVINTIGYLLMLEKGYKAKPQKVVT